jgi:phage antirepressor YoqD-like protein
VQGVDSNKCLSEIMNQCEIKIKKNKLREYLRQHNIHINDTDSHSDFIPLINRDIFFDLIINIKNGNIWTY